VWLYPLSIPKPRTRLDPPGRIPQSCRVDRPHDRRSRTCGGMEMGGVPSSQLVTLSDISHLVAIFSVECGAKRCRFRKLLYVNGLRHELPNSYSIRNIILPSMRCQHDRHNWIIIAILSRSKIPIGAIQLTNFLPHCMLRLGNREYVVIGISIWE